MIQCLRGELDPPANVAQIRIAGETYQATALTNGWLAVYRTESARFRRTVIVVFDLLPPDSALYSGRDLFE
jgi:hypothetical protein